MDFEGFRCSKGYKGFEVLKVKEGIVFNWNHFEMMLLNLRINFLFIVDFLSSSW